MSKSYGQIAFTPAVREVQNQYGSGDFYPAKTMRARAADEPDALTDDEREFLHQRDGFYLATVSETGWPYIQFRGGPAGFLQVVDEHTLGWAGLTFRAICSTSAPATSPAKAGLRCSPWTMRTGGG